MKSHKTHSYLLPTYMTSTFRCFMTCFYSIGYINGTFMKNDLSLISKSFFSISFIKLFFQWWMIVDFYNLRPLFKYTTLIAFKINLKNVQRCMLLNHQKLNYILIILLQRYFSSSYKISILLMFRVNIDYLVWLGFNMTK